jgi:hypothetical protein
MQSLYQVLNEEKHLEGLELDKEEILRLMGLGRINKATNKFEWDDVFQFSQEDCYDAAVKAVRYQEYAAEVLAMTQKRRKDSEAAVDGVLNKSMVANRGMKATEARAAAKGSDEYVAISRRIASLTAWEDYLERFVDVLEKYHYLAKKRLDELNSQHRKTV